MNVFVDTNVLLDLYHLSGPDLDELNKITKLAETGKIKVLVPAQVADEFWKNRERVIREALESFAHTKASQTLPNIIRTNPKSTDLRKAVDQVNDLVKELRATVDSEIEKHELKADGVIEALFKQCPPATVDEDTVNKAKHRRDLGKPPGKQNSLGDAINWEWLLANLPKGENLILISGDGDFESELLKGEPKEFLKREWSNLKGAELTLFRGLPEFLKEHFPDIKLSDEIDKSVAIERLEKSLSFAATHYAITKLNKYDDFTENEIIRIAAAYDQNNQVHMIFGDTDVLSFAEKIIPLAKTDGAKQAVEPLELMLEQLKESIDSDDTPS